MTDTDEDIKQLIDGLKISESDKAAAWRRCKELEADNERLRTALQAERDAETPVLDSYAEENQRFHDEIERLREALREIVEYANLYGIRDEGDGHALVNIARAAIEKP